MLRIFWENIQRRWVKLWRKKNRAYSKTWKNIYRAESIYGLTNIYRKEIKNNYRDVNNCINLKDGDKSMDCNPHKDFKKLEVSF